MCMMIVSGSCQNGGLSRKQKPLKLGTFKFRDRPVLGASPLLTGFTDRCQFRTATAAPFWYREEGADTGIWKSSVCREKAVQYLWRKHTPFRSFPKVNETL